MTAARWAAVLERKDDGWPVANSAGLVKSQLKSLAEFLTAPEVSVWMNGAASVGRNRWRQVPASMSILNCLQIHLFPVQGGQAAILVGADSIGKESAAWWRVISLGVAAHEEEKSLRKLAEQEAELSAHHIALVKEFAQTISVFAEPSMRLRAAAMEIAHAFGAGCVEILLQNKTGWFSIIYDTNHGENTRPLESRVAPGKDFMPRIEPKLIVLELYRGAKIAGYLKIQAANGKLDTGEGRRLAEMYGTLLSGLLINPVEV